jgi:ferritin-like protein
MVNKMVKAMHKKNVLLSEEIYRIKELFGNGFKPVIKEQRKIIKEPRKVIKEQREIIARRVFNLDLSLPAPAQVAKVGKISYCS